MTQCCCGCSSAVPLGGMGTGNFELRGDGTFRQWCVPDLPTLRVASIAPSGLRFLRLSRCICHASLHRRSLHRPMWRRPATRRPSAPCPLLLLLAARCIESQSPGGGAKLDIGALDLAVLGAAPPAPPRTAVPFCRSSDSSFLSCCCWWWWWR